MQQYETIDKKRIVQLIREARLKNNFSNVELGNFVSYLCNIRLTAWNYKRYTEDWKLEMLGNAALAAYKAMAGTLDLQDETRAFNYIFTTIDNAFKRTIDKMHNLPVPEDNQFAEGEAPCDTLMPYYLRNKRRMVKGVLLENKDQVVSAASTMKVKLLKDVLAKATRIFTRTLKIDELEQLIQMARRTREAAC